MKKQIKDLQRMSNNQIIRIIDSEYYVTIKNQLKKLKKKYIRIPLEVEDMYNIFLSKAPIIIKDYDGKLEFKHYLANEIHYALKNHIKHYLTKKQSFLNNYLHFDLIKYKISDLTETSFLDTTPLSDVELEIYTDYVMHDLTYQQIVKKRNCTLYSVRSNINKIKDKLENQVL